MSSVELARIWKFKKVLIVTIVIGAFGTVADRIETWIKEIVIDFPTEFLQNKSILYGWYNAKVMNTSSDVSHPRRFQLLGS